MEELKNLLNSLTQVIAAKLNVLKYSIPSVRTLTHLENGTDTEQRSYRPKDIHDFVDDNKPKVDSISFNGHADEETTSKIPFIIEDGDLDGNIANNEYEVPVDGWYKADFVGNTGIVSGGSNNKQATISI